MRTKSKLFWSWPQVITPIANVWLRGSGWKVKRKPREPTFGGAENYAVISVPLSIIHGEEAGPNWSSEGLTR